MEQRETQADLSAFPAPLRPLLRGAKVFDSSCSEEARVWHAVGEDDVYIKRARPGSLLREAEMTRWMHEKGLAAPVLCYAAGEHDWLVTRALPGKDGIAEEYLSQPRRLSVFMGELLRALHGTGFSGCPVPHRTADYLASVWEGMEKGLWSPSKTVAARFSWKDRREAEEIVRDCGPLLGEDVLIHGDFCLPNVMLDGWKLSGYIDLDNGGVGDRHVDLYWMVWSLTYNLKDDRWGDVFLDAYGRDGFDPLLLRAAAACECFG